MSLPLRTESETLSWTNRLWLRAYSIVPAQLVILLWYITQLELGFIQRAARASLILVAEFHR
jgi:hypothetical protein